MSEADARQRILIVEDDEELALLMQEYLEAAAFNLTVIHSGTEAVDAIASTLPDLVILDLMLPGKDGIAICREVRPQYAGPILMLTASNESVDHIIGLEVGADDFIQKPVEPRILLAHVRALLRRNNSSPKQSATESSTNSDSKSFGQIEIHMKQRIVTVAGQDIELTNPEFDILNVLTDNAGSILSRDDIFQAYRGIEYDGQNRLVDITISQIRQKLNSDGQSGSHIKTIRNKGYLFSP